MTGVHNPLEGMEFRHYSRDPKPFVLDRSREYPEEHRGSGKPPGLWLSVLGEQDWFEWSTFEEFGTESLERAYRVTLRPDARIYTVCSLEGLRGLDRLLPPTHDYGERMFRDWGPVMRGWDGVVIAPYQWRARYALDMGWYWGWDCASGCVWNLDAIASVEPVTDPERRFDGDEASDDSD